MFETFTFDIVNAAHAYAIAATVAGYQIALTLAKHGICRRRNPT